jgi:hypothetical protein
MYQSVLINLMILQLVFFQAWPVNGAIVRADDYSSFWIWGGVRPQAVLSHAENLYILQGQVAEPRRQNRAKVVMIAQGMSIARAVKGRVWLVYRASTLRWTPKIMSVIVSRLEQWRRSDNQVVGLQIDFDAKTKHLQEYADFLRQIRTELPESYRLSITGLLDWNSTGNIGVINQLRNVIDEVAIQTYRGQKTIANYQAYLPALHRLTIPFKIGIVQHGEWQAPDDLESIPWFKGYIVFLQNMPGS